MKALFPLALTLQACALAPTGLRTELEHVSHPMAGWPIEPQRYAEDSLTQANVLLQWQGDRAYLEQGLGYNLDRSSGFYGPPLTYTVRVGVQFSLRGTQK